MEILDTRVSNPALLHGTTPDERKWSSLLHLSIYSFFVLNMFGFLVPLVIWWVLKDKSRFIDLHGKAIFNFAAMLMIATLAFGICMLILITAGFVFAMDFSGWTDASWETLWSTFPLFFVAMIIAVIALFAIVILPLFGVKAASEGRVYRYPLTYRFFQ